MTLHSRLRLVLRDCVLWLYVHAWAPLRNRWRARRGRCHVAVLAYHRVSDEFADGVTVGVGQFRRQTDILRGHYDVLDMPAFLASRGKPCRRPAAVITFDDGYADNFPAAEVLREANLPATFFISTAIVGTDRGFEHDRKRLGKTVPTLSWEQVAKMAQWGFHFAAHTANHVNVGKLPVAEALDDIRCAREQLRARLGEVPGLKWFAYPFGGPDDISDAVRDVLALLGVEYCFSAYGGVNSPDFDTLNILRQGPSCQYSDLAFRAAVEGWTFR